MVSCQVASCDGADRSSWCDAALGSRPEQQHLDQLQQLTMMMMMMRTMMKMMMKTAEGLGDLLTTRRRAHYNAEDTHRLILRRV